MPTRSRFLVALVLAVILSMPGAAVFAADIDLWSAISGPTTADPGEEVTIRVTYGNNSATSPNAAAVNLEFPPGLFMGPDDTTEFLVGDNLGNSTGLFIGRDCDRMLIQVAGPDDTTPGLDLNPGESGFFETTFAMPAEAQPLPVFTVDSPDLFPTGLSFGTRSCESCDDCLGPSLVEVPVFQAELVMADDGSANPTFGCGYPWSNDVTGKIAVIRRGECEFGLKALNAEDSGAIGYILLNNLTGADDGIINMLPGAYGNLVTIPGASLTTADGDTLEAALATGAVTASLGAAPNTANTIEFVSSIFHFDPDDDGLISADTDPDPNNDDDSMTTTLNVSVEVPVASFTSAADGLTVTFTDTSANEPTSWTWDFGDGGSSNDQHPVHTYAAGGTYTVALTAGNDAGNTSASADVAVVDPSVFVCDEIAVAAAGSAPGDGTSVWATDLGITNLGSEAIEYLFTLRPRQTNNGTVSSEAYVSERFTLAGEQAVGYSDIWKTIAGTEEFGAMTVCVDRPEDAGVIARVYNTGEKGTFGQAMVGIPVDTAKTIGPDQKVRLGFLSQNDEFRTNIGFMNLSAETITVTAEFFKSDGTSLGTDSIDILPHSNDQWNKAFDQVIATDVDFGFVDVWTTTAGGSFLTYASIVDNGTGDPSTVWPVKLAAAKTSADCTPVWIAAAGSAPGEGTSQWATDLGIFNLGIDAITYSFRFLPRRSDNTDVSMSDAFNLGGNMSVGYKDIWQALAGTQEFGAIDVCIDRPSDAGVIARVYNTSAEGTFGQSMVGEAETALKVVGPGETVRMGFLSENDAFRTNIGFVNPSANPITVWVRFHLADGTRLGSRKIDLEPYSNDQWNKAFTKVTGDGVDFGYVDVWSPTEGASFITYASVVDNGTGDPTTINPF